VIFILMLYQEGESLDEAFDKSDSDEDDSDEDED
jgi:hypothetical protein